MQKALSLILVAVVSLVATACGATAVITPIQAETEAAQFGVDPNWHLTQEQVDLAGTGTADSLAGSDPSSAASQEPVDDQPKTVASSEEPIDEELNDGAAFDRFIMALFPDASARQYGPLQTVVSGFCSGLVDQESIGLLTRDSDIQKRVLTVSDAECDSMETGAFSVRTSPVNAETWDEAVSQRFARTVWWFDRAAFALKAEDACDRGASAGALQISGDQDLSLSVTVELGAFTTHGDCELLGNSGGGRVSSADAADANSEVTDPSRDVTVYFTRATDEQSPADRDRDLYSLAVKTGEVTQLTSGENVGNVALSPDGTQLVYTGDDDNEKETVYLVDLDGSNKRAVGTINYISGLTWAPDGAGLVHSIEGEDERRLIGRLDIQTGTSSTVVTPEQRSAWASGFVGDDLLYEDSDGNDPTLVRFDIARSEIVDSILLPYGRLSISPDQSQVIVSERSTGELALIDMKAGSMMLRPLPSGPGLEAGLSISPNNRFVAYGVGPEFRANQIFITDLQAPSVRVNLTSDLDTTKVEQAHWSPDSQTIFFSSGAFDSQAMHSVTLDGEVTDLGQTGSIKIVIAG